MNSTPRNLLCLGLFLLLSTGARASDLEAFAQRLEKQYPDVRHLPIETLQAWLVDPNPPPLLLVDVRSEEEYAVSHLPGAVRCQDATLLHSKTPLLDSSTNVVIVAYCSVGIRSSAFVQQLQQQGITNAYNLRGSLFAWANAGLPIVSGDTATKDVHPFNRRWGKLLQQD